MIRSMIAINSAALAGWVLVFANIFSPTWALEDVPFHEVSWPTSLSAMFEFHRLTCIRIAAADAANWRSTYWLAKEMTTAQCVITLFDDAGSDAERDRGEQYFHELCALHPG